MDREALDETRAGLKAAAEKLRALQGTIADPPTK